MALNLVGRLLLLAPRSRLLCVSLKFVLGGVAKLLRGDADLLPLLLAPLL